MREENIGHFMHKLLSSTFEKIDGYSIEKKGGGYIFRGQWYGTRAEVQEAIKPSVESLNNSIKPKQ